MQLSVLSNSSIPAYRQLYDQIAAQILSGSIAPGTALPPIRSVAKELGISVITVRGAWDALLADGLIETRAGSGCYASFLSSGQIEAIKKHAISGPLKELADSAKSLGYTFEETIEMLEKEF